MPRSARILKPVEFKRVFERNASSQDGCFRVLARPTERSGSRLGMAVSRKVDKTAVGRNRIKRVVRESFRAWRAERGCCRAMDIVVLARPASAGRCNEQLFGSLAVHWPRLEKAVEKRFAGETRPEEQE